MCDIVRCPAIAPVVAAVRESGDGLQEAMSLLLSFQPPTKGLVIGLDPSRRAQLPRRSCLDSAIASYPGLLVSLGSDLMESPIFKPSGTHVAELDTPALVVDLSELGRNIDRLHSFFRGVDAKVRPHVGIHRCPAIARMQLAAGGTVGGIAVNTVGEAETFAHSGFEDIFITGAVALALKIARVCSLARLCKMTVAGRGPRPFGLRPVRGRHLESRRRHPHSAGARRSRAWT